MLAVAVAAAAEVNGPSSDPKELDGHSFQTICCYDVRCRSPLKILFENVANEGGAHIFRDMVTRIVCVTAGILCTQLKNICHICGAFVCKFLTQLSFFIVMQFILISK